MSVLEGALPSEKNSWPIFSIRIAHGSPDTRQVQSSYAITGGRRVFEQFLLVTVNESSLP